MRRGLFALALTLTACAAVTGLGDFAIVDDAGTALPDANPGVVDADPRVDAPARAEAGNDDGGSGVVSEAGADADAGAYAAVDSSVRCKATKTCDTREKPVCCFKLVSGTSLDVSCEENASKCDDGRFDFACDDPSDCASGLLCCVDLSGPIPSSSSCRATCGNGQTRACSSSAECSGKACEKSTGTLDDSLPDLRICR